VPRPIASTELATPFTDLERDSDGLARVEVVASPGGSSAALWLDEAHTHLTLFTGDTLPHPARRRKSLGVEPMTCAPNALATGEGLRILQPGESFSAVWGISPGR
jgi:aldose 1-epimerase